LIPWPLRILQENETVTIPLRPGIYELRGMDLINEIFTREVEIRSGEETRIEVIWKEGANE
jgi:hypothetical protein